MEGNSINLSTYDLGLLIATLTTMYAVLDCWHISLSDLHVLWIAYHAELHVFCTAAILHIFLMLMVQSQMLMDMLFLICPLKIMMWLSLVSPKKKILNLYRYILECFSELFLIRYLSGVCPLFVKKTMFGLYEPLVHWCSLLHEDVHSYLSRQRMRKYTWDLMELHHLKQSSRSWILLAVSSVSGTSWRKQIGNSLAMLKRTRWRA